MLPSGFYYMAHELGNKEVDIPKIRLNDSISQFENYLKKHNEETIK